MNLKRGLTAGITVLVVLTAALVASAPAEQKWVVLAKTLVVGIAALTLVYAALRRWQRGSERATSPHSPS